MAMLRWKTGSFIKRQWASEKRKRIFSAEVKRGNSKWTLKFGNWFSWTVQINNEKGTAGGNIKIDLPFKSGLVISVVCVALAFVLRRAGVLVSLVFISFSIYHFRNWMVMMKNRERKPSLRILLARVNSNRKHRRHIRRSRKERY
jgi:hypothetical protein